MISITGSYYENSEIDTPNYQIPLLTTSCGHFLLRDFLPFRTYRKQGRQDWQMLYVKEGKGYFELDGQKKTVGEGEIVFYRPFERQHYWYDEPADIYWLHFTGGQAAQILRELGLLEGRIHYLQEEEAFSRLLDRIIGELQLKSPHFSRFVNALTEQLLCMAARGGEISKSSAVLGKPEIEDTIRYLQANYREPFSVEAWAEQHHISVCWFIRKFRERTGMTPLQYLTRLRIQKAKELLQYLDQIGTVAELVGYSDPLYFSRIFKSRTGVSPTEYRKQIAGR